MKCGSIWVETYTPLDTSDGDYDVKIDEFI